MYIIYLINSKGKVKGKVKVESKAVPLQTWTGTECSWKLRFPDFKTIAHEGSNFVSPTHRPLLPARKYSWHLF